MTTAPGADATARRRGRSRLLLAVAVVSSVLIISLGQFFMSGLYAQTEQPSPRSAAPFGDPLVVAIARTPGGPGEWITYARALEHLQRVLGRPVHVRYLSDRADAVTLVAAGDVDLAFVPTYRYIQLAEMESGQLVATPIIGGRRQETAVVVVRADSEARSVSDLRGDSIALADPHSLGGYSFVLWLLTQDGSDARDHFSRIETGASQDENLSRVASGKVDATCVNRSALATWPDATFRVVAESPKYGMPPLVARTGLSPEVVNEVRAALTSLKPGDGVPEESPVDGFTSPTAADYDFAALLAEYAETAKLDDASREDPE